ncbi:hypothetical protein [Caballeronia sordidicola]|uniref:Uncharacterized protein n=1 Tax=Caballeronia sordidicola TaxID=196367 RepID=A0A242MLZ4_CABSO|nr:hypothetical protein PAMC26510_22085 [Caballeronia sordidicola]
MAAVLGTALPSERQALLILNTLFAWLVNARYLAGNPLSLYRQRARKAKPRVTRFLEGRSVAGWKTCVSVKRRGVLSCGQRVICFHTKSKPTLLSICRIDSNNDKREPAFNPTSARTIGPAE